MPLNLHIIDETSKLDSVILGIGEDIGGPGPMNPKTQFHLEHGSFPTQESILHEISSFEKALIENDIKVFRPRNLKNCNQIFTRDLGFVIDDEFFVSTLVEAREREIQGIDYILELCDPGKIILTSEEKGVQIEGGDVVIMEDKVFVGSSGRTNDKGFRFLRDRLPNKKVIQVELEIDEKDHRVHALHLDCAFQPLGNRHAIIYEDVIKNTSALYKQLDLPEENIYKTNEWQFVNMFTNILSISKDTLIIEKEFIDLKYWLMDHGFKVIEVNFKQISKLSGLLRCATLPLARL